MQPVAWGARFSGCYGGGVLSDGPGAAAVGVLGEAGWWRRCIGHLAERRRRCLSRQVKGWRDRGALLDADAVSEEAVPMSGEWAAEVGLAGHGEGVAGAAVSGMGGGGGKRRLPRANWMWIGRDVAVVAGRQ